MLNDKKIKILSEKAEEITKKLLELQYKCEKLDKKNENKKPDYICCPLNPDDISIICEVKAIISAKYNIKSNKHISMIEETGDLKYERHVNFKKINQRISEAITQYKSLTEEHAQYKNYPFIVVFICDFFADDITYYNNENLNKNIDSNLISCIIYNILGDNFRINQWQYIENSSAITKTPNNIKNLIGVQIKKCQII
jgi:hypothetical protein